jgi:hypothetical protein
MESPFIIVEHQHIPTVMSRTLAPHRLHVSVPPLTASSPTTRTWRWCSTPPVSSPTRIWPLPTTRGGTAAQPRECSISLFCFVFSTSESEMCYTYACFNLVVKGDTSVCSSLISFTSETSHLLASDEPLDTSSLKFFHIV